MNRRTAHAARVEAYKRFHADLSQALYAEEQSRTGQNPQAQDAYDGEAARLAIDLTRANTRAELAWMLRRAFGRYSPFLADRVATALDRFKSATGPVGG